MRGILIDPVAQIITAVEVAKGLQGLYAATGCTCIDIVRLTDSHDLIIDDEGALIADQRCFAFNVGGGRAPIIITGKALLLENDGQGETIATTLPLVIAQAAVAWLPADFDYTPAPPIVIGFRDPAMLQFVVGGR